MRGGHGRLRIVVPAREVARPARPSSTWAKAGRSRFRGHRRSKDARVLRQRTAEQGMLGSTAGRERTLLSQKITRPVAQRPDTLADEAPTSSASKSTRRATSERPQSSYLKTNEGPRRTVHPPAHHNAMIQPHRRDTGASSVASRRRRNPRVAGSAQLERVFEVERAWAPLQPRRGPARARAIPAARLPSAADWISLDLPLSDQGAQQLALDRGLASSSQDHPARWDDVLRSYLTRAKPSRPVHSRRTSDGTVRLVVQALRASPGAPG